MNEKICRNCKHGWVNGVALSLPPIRVGDCKSPDYNKAEEERLGIKTRIVTREDFDCMHFEVKQ